MKGVKGPQGGGQKPPEPLGPPPGRGDRIDGPEAEVEAQVDEVLVRTEDVAKVAKQAREIIWSRLKDGVKMIEGGSMLLDLVAESDTPLGRFYWEFQKHAVAHDQHGDQNELLPISIRAIENELQGNDSISDWVQYVCLIINYQYCSGYGSKKYLRHAESLSSKQKVMLENHLIPAVERLVGSNDPLPSVEELEKELAKKGQEYDGTTYVMMEDLETEKVLACWPTKEQAAIAPLEDFLKGDARKQVMSPMSTILDPEDWPEQVPKSYVRASQETWNSLVEEGYKRGLFQHCPDDEVLRDPQGRKIVNGAGAVPKYKGDKKLQRFISIFVPLNTVSKKIEGDEATLPYVGQVNLTYVPSECEVVIDSEDMASAFNLFKMPQGWRGLFVYEKQVPAHCLGLTGGKPTYVALRTVPMGWLSAVGTVQAAIRHLAFDIAELPAKAEIQKWKEIPEGDRMLLYLDSVDQLRIVSKTMAQVIKGEASAEHKRFTAACQKKGLPTNASKMLAGALAGSLQGGELRSEDGIFTLQLDKMRMNVAMGLYLLGQQEWKQQEVAGVIGRVVFAAAFRRPILAALEDVFLEFREPKGKPVAQSDRVFDEIASMCGLLPMAFTNVRAPVHGTLHATDASPTGAGSCVAHQLKRERGVPNPEQIICSCCREEMVEMIASGEDFECPYGCGGRLCSVACFQWHKEECSCNLKEVPLFSERWSGPSFPLTRAVLREGMDVATPYDRQAGEGMDFFTDEGEETWEALNASPVEAEHHAPDCKTMSRARGRPFWINGVRHEGPPALRDESNVMGFKNLRGLNAVRVRQGNKMGLKSIERCKKLHQQDKVFTLEHPWRSFLWYMKATVELASLPGVRMAVFSNCCFGGRREKWTAVLTNCPEIYEELRCPDCPHGMQDDYQPYYDDEGWVIYPTEKEAEYPEGLCSAYAQGLKRYLQRIGKWPNEADHRVQQIAQELEKYSRFQDEDLKQKVAQRVYELEEKLTQGNESRSLYELLRNGHYRGTDIRLFVEHQQHKEMVPYPAYRWLWKDVLSFKSNQEAHINELEAQALATHVRRLLKQRDIHGLRVMIVIDSQVLFFALGKGRSPSRRLNRVLKRLAALGTFTCSRCGPFLRGTTQTYPVVERNVAEVRRIATTDPEELQASP